MVRFLALLAGAVAMQNSPGPPASSLSGVVLNELRQPLPGAMVFLARGQVPVRTTMSGVDGVYRLQDIAPDIDFELWAEHREQSSAATVFRVGGPGERVTIELQVTPRIRFAEVANSGLNFVLRNGAANGFHMPELMVGGVAALDYNGDGCTDIFFANGATSPLLKKTGIEFHNRLFRNQCDMTFVDVTESAGVEGEGYSIGAAAADYDNDGHIDLFVAGVNRNILYHNLGNGTFKNVTQQVKVGTDSEHGKMWSVAAGWFDYDRDGWLDLFVVNYVDWQMGLEDTCLAGERRYYCHPKVFQGLPNQLFHNRGDGTFEDVSRSSKIAASIGKGMGVAFGDVDGNGFPDVFVANDSSPNFLFMNQGNGTFREVALDAGVAYAFHGRAIAGMGTDVRDYNNDGRPDIVLSAMYFDEFPLYQNAKAPHTFSDETVSSGLALATRSLTGWGIGLYDFDNDRHKDLFLATSHFPGTERLNPVLGADASQPNHVLRNQGDGKFRDVSRWAGEAFRRPGLHRGAAFADFDNDGRIDVVVTALNSTPRLFRNTSPGPAHWLGLRLTGKKNNRDGIGARIALTLPSDRVLYNDVSTSVGYASSSESIVRFGLGPYGHAKKIDIRWPSGQMQTLLMTTADQVITVREQSPRR